MNYTSLIILFFAALYAGAALLLLIGLKRKYSIRSRRNLSVSVFVAARNEAAHIQQCLNSLDKLEYPDHLLEIFIVNDRSEDETQDIITAFTKDKPHFKYLFNNNGNKNLSGKANAISLAIKKSQGEIILITDADCEVPSGWLKNTISCFSDEVGVVAGFTRLKDNKGIFSKIQCLDWCYMLSVAAGSVGLGIPLTCIGNNFAIRRSAYDEVGGYEGVGFSVAEDFALLRAVIKNTDWKVTAPITPQNIVQSKPVNHIIDFFKQRKRWAVGGKSVHWFGKLMIVISVFFHTVIFSLFVLGKFLTGAKMFSVILIGDLLLLLPTLKKISALKLLLWLPVYKFFSLFYMLMLSVILLFNPTVEWKGEKYLK